MISVFVAGLVLASPAAYAQDQAAATPPASKTIKLIRTYQANEAASYLLNVDMTGTAEIRFAYTVSAKVLKTMDGGKAEMEMKATIQGPSSSEMPGVPSTKMVFDSHFMPANMNVQGNEWPYLLIAMSGYVPAADVAEGKPFSIKWEAADKGFDLKGEGTLKEVKDVDGVKVAIIHSDLTGTPAGDTPGKLKIVSHVSAETGKLLKAEGSVEIESGPAIKFTITTAK